MMDSGNTLLFWLLALALLLLALAFLLLPLRGRRGESKTVRALRRAHRDGVIGDVELAERLASEPSESSTAPHSPKLALALLIVVPALTLPLYFAVGSPAALDPAAHLSPANATPATMDEAVEALARRLQAEPDNVEGWLLLARSYRNMERFDDALAAMRSAREQAPDDPDVLVEFAEARALASATRRIDTESEALIERALQINPQHQRGLWLRGISALQRGQPAEAATQWERLLALMPADEAARAAVISQINQARSQAGMPPLAAAADAPPSATAAPPDSASASVAAPGAAGARLTVTVDIADALRDELREGDVLFVFARAPQGPRMPLAIQRIESPVFPVTVTLDDSTSMLPQMTLSSMPEVVVGARVSRQGEALPQPGDLETLSGPVATGGRRTIALSIDRVVE